jgi:7-cyano-7-deazaguanine synthase in queuosine biosynthesis
MTAFALRLTAPAAIDPDEAKASFYWLTGSSSSFTTKLDPNLSSLGPVPALNVDLVRTAVAVYAADHSIPRAGGGSNWNRREIKLNIPVSDAACWTQVADNLSSVIGFLTGDHWTLNFNGEQVETEPAAPAEPIPPRRIVLLSGGADSATGALVSRAELESDEWHMLLSHFSARTLPPIQRAIAEAAEQLVAGPNQQHLQLHLSRNKQRLDGTDYPTESTSRSRSLLFLSLGLAVASVYGVPLWIPENGFASLNPPLGPERLGSVSTRTTHPAFLGGLADVLHAVGAHSTIENPFASNTKGEMFTRAASLIGADEASAYLSRTNSCAHTGQRAFGISPSQSCGVCFGCVVRRAAFSASGVPDVTTYIAPGGNAKLQAWLEGKSVEPAVRSFIKRGITKRDLTGMNLPTSYLLADALDLCERGISELAGLQL